MFTSRQGSKVTKIWSNLGVCNNYLIHLPYCVRATHPRRATTVADKPSESTLLGCAELGAADGLELVGGTAVIVCGGVLGTRRGGGGGDGGCGDTIVVELLGGETVGAGVVVFVTLGVKSVLPAINIYHKKY